MVKEVSERKSADTDSSRLRNEDKAETLVLVGMFSRMITIQDEMTAKSSVLHPRWQWLDID
jgi:hypothetical protein